MYAYVEEEKEEQEKEKGEQPAQARVMDCYFGLHVLTCSPPTGIPDFSGSLSCPAATTLSEDGPTTPPMSYPWNLGFWITAYTDERIRKKPIQAFRRVYRRLIICSINQPTN